MSERYTDEWVADLLDVDKRFGTAGPGELLAGVAPGATVVDYGCGPGYFTLAAARLAGREGRVYAVDLEPRMVELVRRRAAEAGLSNVAAVASDGTRAALPDGIADYIICVQIMHYADGRDGRVAVARDLHRLLKADGRVLVAQWKPKRATGLSYEDLRAIMGAAGLAASGARSMTDDLYYTVARRSRSPAGSDS